MTLEEAATLALQRYRIECAPSSYPGWRSTARKAMRHFGPRTPVDKLTPDRLAGFARGQTKAGSSRETVRHFFAFVREALRQAGVEVDPDEWHEVSEGLPPKARARERILTLAELSRLREAMAPAMWAPVHLAVLTGLRPVELFGAKSEHVNIGTFGVGRHKTFPLPVHDGGRVELGRLKVPTIADRVRRVVALGPEATRLVKAMRFLSEGPWLIDGDWTDREGKAPQYSRGFTGVYRDRRGRRTTTSRAQARSRSLLACRALTGTTGSRF